MPLKYTVNILIYHPLGYMHKHIILAASFIKHFAKPKVKI